MKIISHSKQMAADVLRRGLALSATRTRDLLLRRTLRRLANLELACHGRFRHAAGARQRPPFAPCSGTDVARQRWR